MILLHYSREPLVKRHDFDDPYPGRSRHDFKPSGLWVSVQGKDDWRSWCDAESYGIGKWQTQIGMTQRGKPVLQIGPDDLDAFTAQWQSTNPISSLHAIDWNRLAVEFGGIIIAPYSWDHRYSLNWYYPWDCASGCLWDAAAWEIIGAPTLLDIPEVTDASAAF